MKLEISANPILTDNRRQGLPSLAVRPEPTTIALSVIKPASNRATSTKESAPRELSVSVGPHKFGSFSFLLRAANTSSIQTVHLHELGKTTETGPEVAQIRRDGDHRYISTNNVKVDNLRQALLSEWGSENAADSLNTSTVYRFSEQRFKTLKELNSLIEKLSPHSKTMACEVADALVTESRYPGCSNQDLAWALFNRGKAYLKVLRSQSLENPQRSINDDQLESFRTAAEGFYEAMRLNTRNADCAVQGLTNLSEFVDLLVLRIAGQSEQISKIASLIYRVTKDVAFVCNNGKNSTLSARINSVADSLIAGNNQSPLPESLKIYLALQRIWFPRDGDVDFPDAKNLVRRAVFGENGDTKLPGVDGLLADSVRQLHRTAGSLANLKVAEVLAKHFRLKVLGLNDKLTPNNRDRTCPRHSTDIDIEFRTVEDGSLAQANKLIWCETKYHGQRTEIDRLIEGLTLSNWSQLKNGGEWQQYLDTFCADRIERVLAVYSPHFPAEINLLQAPDRRLNALSNFNIGTLILVGPTPEPKGDSNPVFPTWEELQREFTPNTGIINFLNEGDSRKA